ncbi:hypothetical protein ISP15_12840 [Dyella jejuensis]|uniref:DUF6817 domain-containing protein n=1 Tax=Dyella jejuensis TaxID=1432009 RepID=A0ABW8JJE2_9GAMM
MALDPDDFLIAIGTREKSHSGRTLYEHLSGTRDRLRQWGCEEVTCLAGLYHSIYGTNAFRRASVDAANRDQVRQVIGAEAERLVYLFHILERPMALVESLDTFSSFNRKTGEEVELAEDELTKLIEIESANLLDQKSGRRFFEYLLDAVEGSPCEPRPAVLRDIRDYMNVCA